VARGYAVASGVLRPRGADLVIAEAKTIERVLDGSEIYLR
jgi:hypothetical protein